MTDEGTKAEMSGAGFELLGDPDGMVDDDAAYRRLLADLVAHFRPRDALERILIRDLTEACWDIRRLALHQAWVIDRKAVEVLQRRVKSDLVGLARSKERLMSLRESSTRARRVARLDASIGRTFRVAEKHLSKVIDEYAQNKSFQRNVAYYGWLSERLEAASDRYELSLAQLRMYRQVMGRSPGTAPQSSTRNENCGRRSETLNSEAGAIVRAAKR